MACRFLLPVEDRNFHPGGTALRVETFSPTNRCSLQPKTNVRGVPHSVVRWLASGGGPIGCAEPCYGPQSPTCPNNDSGA